MNACENRKNVCPLVCLCLELFLHVCGPFLFWLCQLRRIQFQKLHFLLLNSFPFSSSPSQPLKMPSTNVALHIKASPLVFNVWVCSVHTRVPVHSSGVYHKNVRLITVWW